MEAIDPKWVDVGLKAVQLMAIVVIAAFTWVATRTKASQIAVDDLRREHHANLAAIARERANDRGEIEIQIADVQRALSAQISNLRAEVVDRVDTIELDVRELRTRLALIPGPEAIERVHSRVDDVAEGMSSLAGQVGEMNKTLHMIQDFLLTGGRK